MSSRGRVSFALLALLALVLVGWLVKGTSTDDTPRVPGADSGLRVQKLSGLPEQVATTWRLISHGGPFPYPERDGTVFGNRDDRLPRERSGYYHGYTVPTPGSTDRGARRLVTGDRGELYYSGDHCATFVVVDPAH
ncbi:MAG: ribonuclease domain-containing protein [Sciscionella sp.]